MSEPAELLRCDRIELRRWRAADADAVDRVVAESLDHLLPWMPWAAGHSRESAVAFVTRCEEEWAAGLAYDYAVLLGDEVVGSCGLMRRIGPAGLEIGYWIHRAWTGRGFAGEAAPRRSRARRSRCRTSGWWRSTTTRPTRPAARSAPPGVHGDRPAARAAGAGGAG